ncbi:MAG: ABC transporter permease [Theionarchaea archaeon]|nr:ABC transporter permease [Theionarchaea archaeon]
MATFVVKRSGEIVITLFIIATLIFVLFRLMPGDPSWAVISPIATAETRAALEERFRVNDPLLQQYLAYMSNLLRGDFGVSFYWEGDVFDILRPRLFPTVLLFTLGTMLAYSVGINLGRIIAWKRGSSLEYGSTVVGLFFYTMPIFWLGLLAIWVFSFKFDLFPLGGMKTPELWSMGEIGVITRVLDVLYHLFLPLTIFTVWVFTGSMLLMKNSMLETVKEDYITTAKAKGLPEKKIRDHHAARNALLPVVTALSLAIAFSFNGGVLTETTFSWPGLGSILVEATLNQDYPLAQGAFILLAAVVLIAVLVADLLYAYLDPGITY